MNSASTLIRFIRSACRQRDGLPQLMRRSRHGAQGAVQLRHSGKSRASTARRTVRARIEFALLALCAAAAPSSASLANSHSPEPNLSPATPDAFDALDALGVDPQPYTGESGFLDPKAAFVLSVVARDARTIVLRWKLADTYYLYRDRFGFSVSPDVLDLEVPRLPPGTDKQDPYFGQTEVYYRGVEIVLPLKRRTQEATEARLEVEFQGCTDRGLCYPPMRRSVTLALPAVE